MGIGIGAVVLAILVAALLAYRVTDQQDCLAQSGSIGRSGLRQLNNPANDRPGVVDPLA